MPDADPVGGAIGSAIGSAPQAPLGTVAGQLGVAQQSFHHTPGGQAGPPASEAEVEALAGRLYDRIRSRLRSELLVGRERAGQITDLR